MELEEIPLPFRGEEQDLAACCLVGAERGWTVKTAHHAPSPLRLTVLRTPRLRISPLKERGGLKKPNFPSTASPENPQITLQFHSGFDLISVGNKSNKIPRKVTLKSHLKRCSGEPGLPHFFALADYMPIQPSGG